MRKILLACALSILFLPAIVHALDVPELRARVNDYAGMISPPVKAELEKELGTFEQTDSTQITILTVPSLEGVPIEDFGIKVAESWKISPDNGIIFIVSKQDRKMRIEVGRRLEGKLTDLTSGRIIDLVVKPRFKREDFDGGFVGGVSALIDATRGEFKADGNQRSEKQDAQASTQEADTLPAQILITGVPFISWRDAAKLKLATNDPVNPSFIATSGMVLEFWGKDRKLLKRADFESELKSSGFQIMSHETSGKAWTITDLKASLAKGVPVAVALPLSPVAHPLALTSEIGISLGTIKGVELKDEGRPRSNALGRMVSLEDLKKIKEQMRMNPMTEDYLIAARLVIGYDDHSKVVIVHDPSFGPAFEIGYNDFDKMWEAADRNYYIVSPKGFPPGMPEKRLAGAYRERTPDERAAEHFVYGYALDCLGQLYEGAEHFEKGLSIPGISKGYQFLLQFELALNLGKRGDFVHAIEAAEKAKALVPEAPSSWEFLSMAYLTRPDGGNREKATQNKEKAQELMKDQRALKKAATTLPADFMIQYLSRIRGWGGGTKP